MRRLALIKISRKTECGAKQVPTRSRVRATPFALLGCLCFFSRISAAQEAESGFELRTTLSAEAVSSQDLTEAPRDGNPVTGGFRAMLYPIWKWNGNWSVDGAFQIYSRPYFFDQFYTQGYGVTGNLMQGHLNYSRFWRKASVVARVGILSTAFGSFPLRYDDAVNPLIDKPLSYTYYSGVTLLGLAGAQVDATYEKMDFRAQFANSSPINPRGVFDRDQYGNWAGGAGYTILQGFRVGASMFRGPYLDRHYAYFFPGEAAPNTLPGTGVGVDVSWGHGPWNVYGEWQRLQMDYRVIPTFREQFAYGEVRRVLAPRWYVAARLTHQSPSLGPAKQVFEAAVGFRPNAFELVKLEYETDNTVAVQFVTTLRPISVAGK
jgi:hypothetical protein